MSSNISLIAHVAYSKVNAEPIQNNNIEATTSFHNIVNTEFNRFATMSPQEILPHIQNVKISQGINQGDNISGSLVSNMREKIGAQEIVTRKALINEASLLDIVSTSNKAKNTIQTMVAVRDKFIESFEKIMSMSI